MPETTLINSRIVSAHREQAFRDWAERIAEAAQAHPGFVDGLRIEQTGGAFHLSYRFQDAAALAAWESSADYRRLEEEAKPFSTPRREVVEGRLPWVQLPSEADGPKWKRFLMTWGAALPIAIAISLVLGALPRPLPTAVQAAVTSFVLIGTMTYLILPRLSRWLKPWTMKDEDGKASVGE